jgi:hypothetical protein
MPCTCNAICDNDCTVNQLCTGNESACSNSYSFTSISIGTIIRASHINELQDAINAERTDTSRRYNASDPAHCNTHTIVACTNNFFGNWNFLGDRVVGETILGSNFDNVKQAINQVYTNSGYGALVTNTYVAGNVIYASQIIDLQDKINTTRNVCICDSHCNCNPGDCGCDGECPSDDYYYYYYYYV